MNSQKSYVRKMKIAWKEHLRKESWKNHGKETHKILANWQTSFGMSNM